MTAEHREEDELWLDEIKAFKRGECVCIAISEAGRGEFAGEFEYAEHTMTVAEFDEWSRAARKMLGLPNAGDLVQGESAKDE